MTRHHAGATLTAGALGTALFLSLFGYWGLVHDARLYALQALARLYPELRGDLYLRFGSQDDYTLFSTLFTPLIQALGLEGAALTLSLLSLLALFTATAYLLTRLGDPVGSPGGCQKWGLSGTLAGTLAVAMLPVGYGALAIFHVAEPFATPRPLAAALGLLAVAFALDRRGLAAGLAALASLLVHPLMAWPAVVVALWVGLRLRLAVAMTLLGALALILAAWAGAPVLGRLFQVMDPEWKSMTTAMAPYLWTASWDASDWNTAAVALLAPLVAAARFFGIGGSHALGVVASVQGVAGSSPRGVSRYVKVALAASLLGASGLLATILLGDGFDNLLSLQLQPWRALWLSHWLGVAGLGLLFVRSLQTRDPADLIAVLGLAGAELLITGAGGLSLIATLAALSLYGRHLSATIDRLLVLMMVAIFALGLVLNLQGLGLGLGMDAALTGLLLQQSAVVILVATGGWLVARFITRPRVRRVALAVGLMLIGALIATGVERSMLLTRDSGQVMVIGRDSSPGSATHSDLDAVTPVGIKITGGFKINGDRSAVIDSGSDQGAGRGSDHGITPSPLIDLLPRQGSILWEGMPLSLWFQWHYPSYLHTLQLTGSVFSREKLMAAKARIAHLEAVLGPLDLINRETVSLDLPPPDARQIERLCADPNLAGIYYAGKQEVPGLAAGARDGDGAEAEAEDGNGDRDGDGDGDGRADFGAHADADGVGGYLTLRNTNGITTGVLALCPGPSTH